jgi:hypothetical protein
VFSSPGTSFPVSVSDIGKSKKPYQPRSDS